MFDNDDNIHKNLAEMKLDALSSKGPSEILETLDRLVAVSGMATNLRNFPIGLLRDGEKERFLELQSFFIVLEAGCFDELGIYRGGMAWRKAITRA